MSAGGEGDDRGRDGCMHHGLDVHEFEQAPGVGEGCAAVHGVAKSLTQLSD